MAIVYGDNRLATLRLRVDAGLPISAEARGALKAANAVALDALAPVAAKRGGTTTGARCSGEPFLSDRWSDTLMSPDQLSRLTPFAVEWPRETGAHTDFPYLRRKIDRGASLDASQIRDVWRANDACLDALAPLLTGDGLPGVEEGEARRMMGRAMVEMLPDPHKRAERDAAFARDSAAARDGSDAGHVGGEGSEHGHGHA